jgi:hypothetical protein
MVLTRLRQLALKGLSGALLLFLLLALSACSTTEGTHAESTTYVPGEKVEKR